MPHLFNIFGKKEPRKQQKKKSTAKKPLPKVQIDYREKNSLVGSILFSLGVNIEFKELKVADYIAKNTAIERKTLIDFVASIKNKRLQKQLEELKQYRNRLLIIEGVEEQRLYSDEFFKEHKVGMHPNAIRGLLLSILLKHKIPIVFTKNAEDTAKFIAVLAKKKEKDVSLNVTKKSLNKKERLQFILEGFPGIGPKNAKKLLTRFNSLKNIFNASEEELQEVIGKKSKSFKEIVEKFY